MKCQKCGAKMVSGHLYCDICGAEYQIVPDFEPEIESSIAESMSNISETLEEKESEESSSLEFEKNKFRVPAFSTILFIVVVCFLILYTGHFQYTHSLEYRSTKALEAMNEYDYFKAAQIYESIRKEFPQDAEWYVKEAEAKLGANKAKEAYHLALLATRVEKNTKLAYEFLLNYLEGEENYIEMNQILKDCEHEDIKDAYREHLCEMPEVNYNSGSYDRFLELAFLSEFEGNIYYTLDETMPNAGSKKYEEPIFIGNGNHVITFIYEDKYGVFGEPVTYRYQVDSEIPMAPVVILESGNYASGQMIEVTAEEGTHIFYTTDSTYPTMNSMEYTGPIPMPLGESEYNFVAYSEKGVASAVVNRKFFLDVKTVISLEEAKILLMQKLIDIKYMLDFNGSMKDRLGVFQYFYKYIMSDAEHNYYIFEEHYLENQINNPLNHFYAVDVENGEVYQMVTDNKGNLVRKEF